MRATVQSERGGLYSGIHIYMCVCVCTKWRIARPIPRLEWYGDMKELPSVRPSTRPSIVAPSTVVDAYSKLGRNKPLNARRGRAACGSSWHDARPLTRRRAPLYSISTHSRSLSLSLNIYTWHWHRPSGQSRIPSHTLGHHEITKKK